MRAPPHSLRSAGSGHTAHRIHLQGASLPAALGQTSGQAPSSRPSSRSTTSCLPLDSLAGGLYFAADRSGSHPSVLRRRRCTRPAADASTAAPPPLWCRPCGAESKSTVIYYQRMRLASPRPLSGCDAASTPCRPAFSRSANSARWHLTGLLARSPCSVVPSPSKGAQTRMGLPTSHLLPPAPPVATLKQQPINTFATAASTCTAAVGNGDSPRREPTPATGDSTRYRH